MIIVTVRITVTPQRRPDVLELLYSILEPTRVQPGCLSCRIFQDVQDNNLLSFEEVWQSQADLERHVRSDDYRRILAAIDLSEELPEIQLHTISHTKGMEVIHAVRGV